MRATRVLGSQEVARACAANDSCTERPVTPDGRPDIGHVRGFPDPARPQVSIRDTAGVSQARPVHAALINAGQNRDAMLDPQSSCRALLPRPAIPGTLGAPCHRRCAQLPRSPCEPGGKGCITWQAHCMVRR